MAAQDDISLPDEQPDSEPAPPRRHRCARWLAVFGLVAALGLAALWLGRKEIADDYLSGQLADMGLPARYELGTVGPARQVLKGLVIGDPAHPDFTADEIALEIDFTFGIPSIGRITLVRPRLYGSLRGGQPSFGSLDKVLFAGGKEPFRWPDLDLAIVDGRALLNSDWGPVGAKLEGQGHLRGGFAGALALAAPDLAFGDCRAKGASAFGKLAITAERPAFEGPLRLASFDCPKSGITMADAAIAAKAGASAAFDAFDADLSLSTGKLALGGATAGRGTGTLRASWKARALTARYDLALAGVTGPQVVAGEISTEGMVRTQEGFARIDADGSFVGNGLALGKGLDSALASAQTAGAGSLAAPMLAQVRAALAREARGSALAGSYTLRQTGAVTNLVVPQTSLTGGSGQPLLALSRLQVTSGGSTSPRIAGNFATGGAGLPRLSGRMERRPGGQMLLHMSMAEYRAGAGRLAVPELMLAQSHGGELGFAGRVLLSGPLPGGAAEGLVLPVEGNWSAGRGLSLWRKCTPVAFERLSFAALTLNRRALTLCPGPGGAILRVDGAGTRIAAGASTLALSGRLGTTPIRLVSGPVGFAMPGTLLARDVKVDLGAGEATRFTLTQIEAKLGDALTGRFVGTEARLAAVPLGIIEATGGWRYADGKLFIEDGAFRLLDRQTLARFEPLTARGASLSLIDGQIAATALLREPKSDRAITRADIRHDLNTGRGSADLAVDGITFDQGLQPDTLSGLMLGVIANAQGSVTGSGRIDWTLDGVTSMGDFTTQSLDFAAAFGPAKGVAGTVHFSDLLGLVTAPDQRLRIASINPGIEANDGELSFEMRPDSLLVVNGARWPFLGGTLVLEPTRMVLGAAETRRFTLSIDGLDAAKFIERMDMGNLAATGTFDGKLPLVFDENGGRIEGGALVSRAPGGNVSYVGQLTYKDLSPMANFAFDALRSIDYRGMRINLDGALEGEIVTRVSFDGISQGTSAKRNFITRQIAKLPIRFNISLRAPFFKLVTSVRSIYDPAFVRDPRLLGLIGPDGKPIIPPGTPDDPRVQPPVSEKKP